MDFEDEIEVAIKCFAEDFRIEEDNADKIIYEFDLVDVVLERYADEIKEVEESKRQEAEYDRKSYNDNWADHTGV